MINRKICKICDNYSAGIKCDIEDNCEIAKTVKENENLKKEIKALKKENADLRLNMSYMVNPNAIGDRNEMGAW